MVRHSVRSSNRPLSVPCAVWPSPRDDLFVNWMWIMHFCRVFLLRRSTWNNLRGSSISLIPIMYASFTAVFMASNRLHRPVFSPQQLSSHIGLCGLQVRHVSLPPKGQDRFSSGSYLCGRHHHHRHSRAITRLIQELGWELSLKDLSPLQYFLDVECHRTPSGLFLSQ